MRPNSILIIVIAIVMGGIAAFLARNWLLSRTQGSSDYDYDSCCRKDDTVWHAAD